MQLSKQIELQAKKEIVDAINILLNRYLKEGVTFRQLKKYFKQKLAQTNLIKDINSAGYKYFDDYKTYKYFVLNILHEVLLDKKSEVETMELQSESLKITKFSEFEIQKESMDYSDISAEYLFNDIGYANDDMDILASFFNTKEEYIEVKNKDYCLYEITDFKTDITKNNRVKIDVLLLADFQIEKMKENVTRKIISGVYKEIPQDIVYMDILIKPHTILDKQKLKESIDEIVDKNILNIITYVTKYEFVKKYGENYFIWKKVK